MGLDACVHCDCYEAGRLRSSPDPSWAVYVDVTGRLESRSEDMQVLDAFEACDAQSLVRKFCIPLCAESRSAAVG